MAVNLLFRRRYTDLCYGYNAFWRHCLEHMHITCAGFEVETVINVRVARAGLAVVEVPSIEHPRIYGESKLNAVRDGVRVLRAILTERVRSRRRRQHDEWRPAFRELPPGASRDESERAVGGGESVAAGEEWVLLPIPVAQGGTSVG
jgi:hypothetical protein